MPKRWTAKELQAWREAVEPYKAALAMIREAVGELFGPIANLPSEEAVACILYDPSPTGEAQAIVDALIRVANKESTS